MSHDSKMRSARTTLYTAARALGALLITIPGLAYAEPAPHSEQPVHRETDELDLWVPAFSIYSGAIGQNIEGSVSSCCGLDGTSELRPSTADNKRSIAPFVGGSIEVMTPAWSELPAAPRLFFHADGSGLFDLDRDLARENAPDTMVDPMRPAFSSVGILGQGSTVNADYESLMLGGGVGIALTFELWDRRIRIKPSLEYQRNEVTVTGVVNRAQQIREGFTDFVDMQGRVVIPRVNSSFRFVELEGSETRAFHGIGPGLELEMEAARAGPIMLTVFASAQVYHWLGDRNITIRGGDLNVRREGPHFPPVDPSLPAFVQPVTPLTDPEAFRDDQQGMFQYKQNRWGYRGGIGIRFRWQPE